MVFKLFFKKSIFSASPATPATFSKCVPRNSNILSQKFQGKKRFFHRVLCAFIPRRVDSAPPPNRNRVNYFTHVKMWGNTENQNKCGMIELD